MKANVKCVSAGRKVRKETTGVPSLKLGDGHWPVNIRTLEMLLKFVLPEFRFRRF